MRPALAIASPASRRFERIEIRSAGPAPGDLILCGASLGVLPMKPDTTIEVVIEGLGTLRNVYG